MKILFAGSPEAAVPALQACVGLGEVTVLANLHTAVASEAKAQNLSLETVCDKKLFAKYDVAVICAYGNIFSREILAAPRLGCVNLHYSLLPRWRGASPVQAALLAGDLKTGVSLQKMVFELDAGDVIAERVCEIGEMDNCVVLMKRLAKMGGELIASALPKYFEGKIELKSQNEAEITFCKKIKKSDGEINLENESAKEIVRKIRAYAGWPSVFWQNVKILDAEVIGKLENLDFEVLDKNGVLRCAGNTFLQLKNVQMPGKNVLDVKNWLNGAGRRFLG